MSIRRSTLHSYQLPIAYKVQKGRKHTWWLQQGIFGRQERVDWDKLVALQPDGDFNRPCRRSFPPIEETQAIVGCLNLFNAASPYNAGCGAGL